MAESPLRALVVGSGWGRNHALAYQAHPDVELAGIVGRSGSERSRKLADELRVPLFEGLDEALSAVGPDLVSCATKEAEHAGVTVAALEAGADVICEKMMADSLAAGQRMLDTAEATGRRLMIGYNYRFSPSALKLHEWLRAGKLGELSFITGFAFGYCLHHTLDLMIHLVGAPVVELFCVFDPGEGYPMPLKLERFEEFCYSAGRVRSLTMRFANGSVGTLIGSDAIRTGHPAVKLELVGADGRCVMDDIVGGLTFYGAHREGELWRPSLIMDRLDLPSTTQAAVTAFINAVRDNQPTPVPGTDGYNRLLLEAKAMDSAAANTPIPTRG